MDKESEEDQLKRIKAVFELLDKDHNGNIDLDELQYGMHKLSIPSTKEEAAEFFKKLGKSHNGKVGIEAFTTFMKAREAKIKSVFKELDLNKDNILQTGEIKKGFEKLGMPVTEEELSHILNLMDTDHNKAIDYEEFRNYLMLQPRVKVTALFKNFEKATIDIGELMVVPDEPKKGSKYNSLKLLIAGGCAGAVSRTAVAPLERVKVLFQTQSSKSAEYKSVGQSLVKIFKEEGWRGCFKGNGTNVIKIAPESAARAFSFETIKKLICKDPNHVRLTERFFSGSMAGVIAQTLIYPLEITKTRLAVAHHGEYNGIIDCLYKIIKLESPRSLYKGYLPSTLGIIPYAGVDLAIYTSLRDWYILTHEGVIPSPLTLVACGGISSACGQLSAYPLALMRTRLQIQGMQGNTVKYHGLIDCLSKTIKTEGFVGLYRGLGTNLLKALPAACISCVIFENVKKLVNYP